MKKTTTIFARDLCSNDHFSSDGGATWQVVETAPIPDGMYVTFLAAPSSSPLQEITAVKLHGSADVLRYAIATSPCQRDLLRRHVYSWTDRAPLSGQSAIDDVEDLRREVERLAKERYRAVQLLHMLDKPHARHPDVEEFLDSLED